MNALQPWLDRVFTLLDRFVRWLTPYVRRLWALMQRLIAWWRSIDWPEIPLTPFQWIAVLFTALFFVYVWATPIFEASDEIWHFGMVEHIALHGDLPVQDPANPETIYRQEGSQPPLYYALAAALIAPIDISDADDYREPNPHVQAGVPGSFGNKNLILHDVDGPPLAGTPLAVYTIRAFNVLLGLVTVWAVYQVGQLASPKRPVIAILAAGVTAFNPMFLFIMASVNNDNLVIALNSVAIYFMLVTLRDGFEWRRSLAIGVLIALAALTKLSALVLVPVFALTALYIAQRDRDWRGLLVLGGSMLGFWLALSGWWYARNLLLYGELFGTSTMVAVAGPRMGTFNLLTLFNEYQGFRISYWGLFGAVNIQTGGGYYALVDFFVFMSIFGAIFAMLQLYAIRDFLYARREFQAMLFLLAIFSVGVGAVVAWTAQTYASQGRLLFPFIAAISPLLAIGFIEVAWWFLFLLSPPDRSFVQADSAVPEPVLRASTYWPLRLLGLMAVLLPIFTIAPSYAPPSPVEEVPPDAQTVYARYGDVELIAYDAPDRRYDPGDEVPITLYWRVLEASERDNSLFITLLTPEGQPIGQIDTYPGAGTLRTTQWEAGAIYPDRYRVRIDPTLRDQHPLRAQVGWWHRPTSEFIEPLSAEDAQLEAVVLDTGAVVRRGMQPTVDNLIDVPNVPEVDPTFGDAIRLEQFRLDTDVQELVLLWENLNAVPDDYTVFVHVIGPGGDLVTQSDVAPRLPTSYWRFGERFVTRHALALDALSEAGSYEVLVGWYDPAPEPDDEPRLAVPEREDGAFSLLTFSVEEDGAIHNPYAEAQAEADADPDALNTPQPVPAPPGS